MFVLFVLFGYSQFARRLIDGAGEIDAGCTLDHSVVFQWAQGVWLQVRSLGMASGGGVRQAASLTLIVSVAEISWRHWRSRVCTPSGPHVALHALQSVNTHLIVIIPFDHFLRKKLATWRRQREFISRCQVRETETVARSAARWRKRMLPLMVRLAFFFLN